jgi:RimJ/RimL family protein N-acetyltransferase
MDKEDIIARFMYDKPLFPKRDVSCMCRLDYDRNMAVLALAGEIGFEKVVGIGVSFYQPATNTAEVAFSVLRQWQGKRIASVIIRKLIPEAIKRGTDGFMAYTLPNNRRMIRLFEALPYKVKKFTQEGILVLSCSFRNMA